jgi:hypothetical protein
LLSAAIIPEANNLVIVHIILVIMLELPLPLQVLLFCMSLGMIEIAWNVVL